jgi:hypothetical protein
MGGPHATLLPRTTEGCTANMIRREMKTGRLLNTAFRQCAARAVQISNLLCLCEMLIIIIFLINVLYNYYISNTGLVEECHKEENVAVTGAASTFTLKRRLSNVLSNITYLPDTARLAPE